MPRLVCRRRGCDCSSLAQENRETLSEAGLPLANLAFGEALRYARATGPSEELWEAIPGQVLRAPSPLIPALLDQLEEIAGTNTTLQAGVEAWRTLWNARLKLHDIAEAIRQTGKLRGITTTNFWIEHDQTRWLCVLNPDISSALKAADGGLTGSTNEVWTAVRFLPKSVAERALVRALENSEVKLPAYLGLAAWLEGEPLGFAGTLVPGPGHQLRAAAAGRGQRRLFPTSASCRRRQAGRRLTGKTCRAARASSCSFTWPTRRCCSASYRRHALLLAGLVAASAFAALIGVLASWRAFQRQLRLNELKSNFVSSVSHELRSPIASVRLMAESLERGKVPEAPKQHEYFRFIVQECRRLSSLIENVLDFSRIEQGRKQYDFEPTDLVALTQQTVKLMETYAAERGVKLQLQLDTPTLRHQPSTLNSSQLSDYQLLADGKALQQALVNLIDNALKHSPKGETVTVGLEVQKLTRTRVQHPTSKIDPAASIQQPATRITHHASRITPPPLGRGPRRRHPAFRTGKDLRALLPPRLRAAAPDPGRGDRPEHREAHRRGPRRPGARPQRRRPGEPIYHRVARVTNHQRNPKPETRNPNEVRNPEVRSPKPAPPAARAMRARVPPWTSASDFGSFGLRTLDFGSPMERILIIEDELPMRTALHDVLAGGRLSRAHGAGGRNRPPAGH